MSHEHVSLDFKLQFIQYIRVVVGGGVVVVVVVVVEEVVEIVSHASQVLAHIVLIVVVPHGSYSRNIVHKSPYTS